MIYITGADRLQNNQIREETYLIRHKILRWFGHVCFIPKENVVNIAYKQAFKGKTKRGRSRRGWSDQIRQDSERPLLTAERCVLDNFKMEGIDIQEDSEGIK